MKTNKNNRTTALALLLVALLVVAYKVMFVSSPDDFFVSENMVASQRVEAVLKSVEQINFETNIILDPKFMSLQSIQRPLISLPIGKKNPFSISGSSN